MGGYRIKVKIELIECDDCKEQDVVQGDDGCFTMAISEEDAVSIDRCESAILRTAHPTIRDAIAKHLSALSKKKPLKGLGEQK